MVAPLADGLQGDGSDLAGRESWIGNQRLDPNPLPSLAALAWRDLGSVTPHDFGQGVTVAGRGCGLFLGLILLLDSPCRRLAPGAK